MTPANAGLLHQPNDTGFHTMLAQAYLNLGNTQRALEQWEFLIQTYPYVLDHYRRVTQFLARDQTPQQVLTRLKALPRAKPDLIDLAMAELLARQGDHKAAADTLQNLVKAHTTIASHRAMAMLASSESLVRLGQEDLAYEQLDKLAAIPAWRNRAMVVKARLLTRANEPDKAADTMIDLISMARREYDAAVASDKDVQVARARTIQGLRAAAEGLLALKRPEQAVQRLPDTPPVTAMMTPPHACFPPTC